jgi:GTP diphosphokinase / guanosine-3',5'-bis(diphosphate) 3'-diphosphatase
MSPSRIAKTVAPSPSLDDGVPEYLRQLERVASYLPAEQLPLLRRAWQVGAAAHEGQTRKSGEPYITHPVAVAQVLAELGLDVETLIAAILHDTIEDTPLTHAEIAEGFGESVAELVDGVTKLDKLHFRDRQEAAAESFRKMLLAMSRDLRVIMIKLADRLHNMRTLGAQSPEARKRIAKETLDIYAPIAQRLGMNLVKSELQDLGFRAMYPWRHAIIDKHSAARVDGADRSAPLAASDPRRAGAPPGQPYQDALEHLQQDARRRQKLRPGDGRVRFPRGGGQRAALLPGIGIGARAIQTAGRAIP